MSPSQFQPHLRPQPSEKQHLSNDAFLTQLATLFTDTHAKNHGSVFLSQKTLTMSPSTDGADHDNASSEDASASTSVVLLRATNGASQSKPSTSTTKSAPKTNKKIKLSTLVQPSDLESFYARYAECCKTGMSGEGGLRRRDRRKNKTKAKSKKSKGKVEKAKG